MLTGIISLATYGILSGGAIGNLLFQLENLGFFAYVLPFMVIFAIIYAILSKAKFLGDNNAINVILSLAVALMALQFQFVSYFFSEIFPRLGVVLSILLVFIILMSLFVDFNGKAAKVGFGIFAGIAGIVIVLQSFSESFGWGSWDLFNSPFWWDLENNLPLIFVIILVIGGLIAIIFKGNGGGRRGGGRIPYPTMYE